MRDKNNRRTNIKIVTITNITLEPFFSNFLRNVFTASDIDIELYIILVDEIQDSDNIMYLSNADYVVIILDFQRQYNIDWFSTTIDDILLDCVQWNICFYNEIKNISSGHVLWFGYEDYSLKYKYFLGHVAHVNLFVDCVNFKIQQYIKDTGTYIDFKSIIAKVGTDLAFDNKNKYRWNALYAKNLILEISKEIYKQYCIDIGNTPKCIVLDCDNVLWGGIVSEVGLENVNLANFGFGRHFYDFQQFLLALHKHGIILAICSKNDLSDVLKMFREHSEMVLKEKHISCFQVGWDDKPSSIRKISELLNIGLDSIVFIDDSKFEIMSVHELLPEVKTILYDKNTIYEQLGCFNLKNSIDIQSVEQRMKTYKTNIDRIELQKKSKTFEEFLKSLEIRVEFQQATFMEYNRIAELTQRTNRCTNGKRYTVDELRAIVKNSSYQLYSVSVRDKFSDFGLVGVLGIKGNVLDLFSLSCRVIGRNVEGQMINFAKENGVEEFDYIETSRNKNIISILNNEFSKGE